MKIPEKLMPGDWVLMEFGYGHKKFYVAEVIGDKVLMSQPSWLVSGAMGFDFERYSKAEYIGRGKLKWYWRFLPWRDLVVKYTYPN